MTLKTKFDISQEVNIIPLKIRGIVTSIYYSETGLQYNVRYFDKLEMKTVYFYENELTKENISQEIGFNK